ncbi:peptidylprolyl isomerase [Vibrio sp. UCD-FRSSP16_10]|uniref:peptidylprolyl isomerase n=1 Tax=unclassified Vibrio TaxID=2614977 RepID=UPI0007FE4640|nr:MULTISPECIES: peptidylprolyl isomerase [unclassified Vibrio]OBT16029.1 peptidylprolyl isomerase [Vibrio sp. UCD-FRSSP16_30]OBT21111.1 peptidylprolyl isomerase [Vibrio sp. UCD-FRSSP16_10]
MMERLREGVNSVAVKIILGLIILSFVFTGVSGYLGGGSSTAAKVGNTEISRAEFEMAYQNERNRAQQQMGDYFTSQLGDPAFVQSFRQRVLDQMVNQILLEQYAESMGLRVSDQKVREVLLSMPQFQSNGQFDQEVYQAALRRGGYNAESFAEYLRSDMVRQKILGAVEQSEFVLPKEVAQASMLLTQTRDIRTVTIQPSEMAKAIVPTAEQLQEFYKNNPDRFTRPEQYKISYVELSAKQMKKSDVVTDKEAKDFYEKNIDRYSTQEQRSLSHILVQDEAKAKELLAQLKAGSDFATVAKENSEDLGSAENGGALGWVEKGVMDPKFEAAAFALQSTGDYSDVVKSDFGYHIIKLDALKAPQAKPFAKVVDEIKTEMADQQAVDRFYDLQNKLETVAFEFPDSLDDAAEAVGQKVVTTDFISNADAPAVLKTPAVMQELQTPEVSEDGLNSAVVEVDPEHIIVVRIEDSRPQTVLPYQEVAEQVKAQYQQVEGRKQATELADKVVTALEAGDNSLLTDKHLSFSDVENINRSSALSNTVFAIPRPTEDAKHYAKSVDANGNIVVIELVKVNNKIDAQYNEQIGQQLKSGLVQQDLMGLLQTLRQKTDIEYHLSGDAQ